MLDLSAVWSSHWKHVEPRYTLPNQVLCKGRYPDKICSPCVASIRWARSADQIKCFALTLSFLFTTTDQHTVHITTDAAQIHNSIYSCWLTNFKILHLGQLLVLDPECTHHSFFLGENHGLRFGRANSHPTHFIFSCKRPQCKSLPDETRRTTSSAKDPESTTPDMLHLPPHDWA